MGESKSTAGTLVITDILKHHGIKGMHWGVHRNRTEISDDAARAKAVRTVHKSSGVKALSNKDLQDFITRANLEKQFNSLTPTGEAKAFLIELIKSEGKTTVKTAVKNQAAGQIKKLLQGTDG